MQWVLLLSLVFQLSGTFTSITEVMWQDYAFNIRHEFDPPGVLCADGNDQFTDWILKWFGILLSVVASCGSIILFKYMEGHRRVASDRFLGKSLFIIPLQHCVVLIQTARIIVQILNARSIHENISLEDILRHLGPSLIWGFMMSLLCEICYIGLMFHCMCTKRSRIQTPLKTSHKLGYGHDDNLLSLDDKLITA